MIDSEKPNKPEDDKPISTEKPTKPAGQDVGPPSNERVDDEVGSDEGTTTRQE